MQIMKIINLITFVGFLVLGLTCSNSNKSSKKKQYLTLGIKAGKKPAFYSRDSLFIIYSVRQWINQPEKYPTIHNYYYNPYHPSSIQGQTQITVDSIFYSPDSLKFLSLIVLKYKTKPIREKASEDEKQKRSAYADKTFFDGYAVVGYRKVVNKPWSVYHLPRYHPVASLKYDNIKYALRYHYFKELKDQGESARDKDGKHYIIQYDYNINDSLFWTKSPIWTKGLRIPGYYNFQTRGNVVVGDDDPIVSKIDLASYPDSLLSLFYRKK